MFRRKAEFLFGWALRSLFRTFLNLLHNLKESPNLILFTLLLLISTLVSFEQTINTFDFKIQGITCQSCVNTTIQILKQVDGVDSVSVDHSSKREELKSTL